ncbi:MAG: hypothetical protein ACTHL3_05075 [Candidatus Nitrosocosmicus sp.]
MLFEAYNTSSYIGTKYGKFYSDLSTLPSVSSYGIWKGKGSIVLPVILCKYTLNFLVLKTSRFSLPEHIITHGSLLKNIY